MTDEAPHVRLMKAAAVTIAAVDFVAAAGVAGMTIRHGRNRHPSKGERPCISIFWLGNEDQARDGQYLNMGERAKVCHLALQADLRLETEESGDDPTGWGVLSRVLAAAFEALRDPASPIMQLCEWIAEADTNPSEESTPDEGRLVQDADVVYRVLSDQPNVLLAPGEQG